MDHTIPQPSAAATSYMMPTEKCEYTVCSINNVIACMVDGEANREIPDILGLVSWCTIPRDAKPELAGEQIQVTSGFSDQSRLACFGSFEIFNKVINLIQLINGK